MNVQLSDFHLECIDFMNKEQIPYFIDDVYLPSSFPNYKVPERILQVCYPFPTSLADERLLNKLKKAYPHHRKIYSTGHAPNIWFTEMPSFDLKFQEIYHHRTIINIKGININFKTSDSLATHLPAKQTINVNLDKDTETGRDHLFTLATLQLYNVEYLVIDEYPLYLRAFEPVDNKNIMRLWLNTELENAKLARKANKISTGNPPSIKYFKGEMINFHQGNVYWSFSYKYFDFQKMYQQRQTLNISGQTVHFFNKN